MSNLDEIKGIVGAANVNERSVRDLWPEEIVRDRIISQSPKALAGVSRAYVARPLDRDQLTSLLRWANAHHVVITPMGGGTGAV